MTASSPRAAQRPAPTAAVAPESVARQGVLSALGPTTALNQRSAGSERLPVAWLRISKPTKNATPTATSACVCGWSRRVVGEKKVLALIAEHETHRENCPQRHPERRNAA